MDLVINLEYKPSIPLYRRLSDAIRRAIIEGRLKPGESMPSVRDLAVTMQVSRTTILKAFDDLQKQDYVMTISGAGSYVCDPLPGELADMRDSVVRPSTGSVEGQQKTILFSKYGQRVLQTANFQRLRLEQLSQINFCGPPLDLTPLTKWRQLLLRHCRLRDIAQLAHAREPLGYPPLRDAVSAYLHRARALKYSPEQLIVFASQQFKLEIPARLLIDPGDLVALEEPGYPDARMCLGAHGAAFINIPVDEEGIDVNYLTALSRKLKCVYVTPSHQDPTGVVMSLSRRKQLLDWADKTGTLIIEDDYDSEYRYGGEELPSLHGLDRGDNVIYISSLWKVLFPMVRMGFLVVPRCLIRPVLLAKMQTERNLPLLEQFALTDFINEGHLEKHIKRTKSIYAKRRQILIHALTVHLKNIVSLSAESAGLHLLVHVESRHSDQQLIETAMQSQLSLMSTSLYYSGAHKPGEFLMPFAHLHEEEIEENVFSWSQFIKS